MGAPQEQGVGRDRVGAGLAGLSRACVRHRWWVVAAWTAVLLVGAVVGSDIFSRVTSAGSASDEMESIRLNNLVYEVSPAGDSVLVLVDGVTPDSAGLIRSASTRAGSLPDVHRVVSADDPLSLQGQGTNSEGLDPQAVAAQEAFRSSFVASDGRAVLVIAELQAGLSAVDQRRAAEEIRGAFAEVDALPGTSVRLGGLVLVNADLHRQAEHDTRRGELIAVPLTLLVLSLIFRGLTPALVPIAGAVASVAGAMVVLLFLSRTLAIDRPARPGVRPLTCTSSGPCAGRGPRHPHLDRGLAWSDPLRG